MKKILSFILVLTTLTVVAQTYSIEGTVKNLPKNTAVELKMIFAGDFITIDTAYANAIGEFLFLVDTAIAPNGLYEVHCGKNASLGKYRFIFDNENVTFNAGSMHPESIVFSNSPQNENYYYYLKQFDLFKKKQEILMGLMMQYPTDNKEFIAALQKEYLAVATEFEIVENLYLQDTTNYLSVIISANRRNHGTEFTDFENYTEYLQQHFFDKTNLTNPRALYSDVYQYLFMDYLLIYFRSQTTDLEKQKQKLKEAVDNLLKQTQNNNEIYEYAISFLIKNFEQFGLSELTEYVALQSNISASCTNQIKDDVLQRKINSIRRTAIGQTAPDISAPNVENVTVKLSDIKADYKLVVFWASWCPHCKTLLTQLEQAYKDYNRRGLEIITLSLDTEPQAWQAELKGDRQKWTNLCEQKGWDSQAAQQYGIYATPTMFLLNAQNQIIAKPNTTQDLSKYLTK